jgi:hypothetical protein
MKCVCPINQPISDLEQFIQLPRVCTPEKGQKSWASSVFKKQYPNICYPVTSYPPSSNPPAVIKIHSPLGKNLSKIMLSNRNKLYPVGRQRSIRCDNIKI